MLMMKARRTRFFVYSGTDYNQSVSLDHEGDGLCHPLLRCFALFYHDVDNLALDHDDLDDRLALDPGLDMRVRHRGALDGGAVGGGFDGDAPTHLAVNLHGDFAGGVLGELRVELRPGRPSDQVLKAQPLP